jgi:multicomponent Na+:H+ antiporter subunit F
VARNPLETRILALDTLTLILVAFLALSADAADESYALDAALILALLSFVGTLAAARYYSRGSLFR